VKLLFDSCMSPVVADELRAEGTDVVWVGDWPRDPGDPAILAQAYREGRVLITLDNDFGELIVARKHPHVGLVRLVDVPLAETTATCRQVVSFYARELAEGAIIVVEKGRTRVRESSNDA
jgi:predicted nuclease of predicted toxin-antitoxin system